MEYGFVVTTLFVFLALVIYALVFKLTKAEEMKDRYFMEMRKLKQEKFNEEWRL